MIGKKLERKLIDISWCLYYCLKLSLLEIILRNFYPVLYRLEKVSVKDWVQLNPPIFYPAFTVRTYTDRIFKAAKIFISRTQIDMPLSSFMLMR